MPRHTIMLLADDWVPLTALEIGGQEMRNRASQDGSGHRVTVLHLTPKLSDEAARTVARLDRLHRGFFEAMRIDQRTGVPRECPGWDRRFASHPYVGSRYGQSRRILFVGLDIGVDGGHLLSFETRRRDIEDKRLRDHNPHIAGTCCVALSLLPPECGWPGVADSELTGQQLLRENHGGQWKVNPLSFVGLTNRFKWIRIGRDRLAGGRDRRYLSPEAEQQFLTDEIRCYRPEVVVFQGGGQNFARSGLPRRLSSEFEVRVLRHPSHRGRRHPRELVEPLWVGRPDQTA